MHNVAAALIGVGDVVAPRPAPTTVPPRRPAPGEARTVACRAPSGSAWGVVGERPVAHWAEAPTAICSVYSGASSK